MITSFKLFESFFNTKYEPKISYKDIRDYSVIDFSSVNWNKNNKFSENTILDLNKILKDKNIKITKKQKNIIIKEINLFLNKMFANYDNEPSTRQYKIEFDLLINDIFYSLKIKN